MTGGLEPRPVNQDERQPFIVSSDGEATREIAHLQQVGLEFTRLSPSEPYVEVDARKVAGESIQVMFLDFGMPPRILTISGDFKTDTEVSISDYIEENDSSPNTLHLNCPAYGYEGNGSANTHFWRDGNNIEHSVPLRRGEYIELSHSGEGADTRNGFISNSAEIVLAMDWLEADDMNTSAANLLTVGYIGHSIRLQTQSNSNAFVIYAKSIGYADRRAEVLKPDSEELQEYLGRLSTQDPTSVVRELFGTMAVLGAKYEEKLGEAETLEALLAHNKSLLSEERRLSMKLKRDLEAARDGQEIPKDSTDWFRGTPGMNASDSTEACKILGIDPTILKTNPGLVANMASMVRKAWAKSLHPDLSNSDSKVAAEDLLKSINNAADILEDQFKK